MHPIERLRHVARAAGADPALLGHEAAGALMGFADDPAGLVIACRRLVDRHVSVGPVWWLAARVLLAEDAFAAAAASRDALGDDDTARVLVAELPQAARVVVIGWPDTAADALARRADVEVLAIDASGYGRPLAERLRSVGISASRVPEAGLGAAVELSTLVLIEATALGPGGLIAAAGSHAAAAVARHAGLPVWAIGGVGRALPDGLWRALVARLATRRDPWDFTDEIVPADLIDAVVGPCGVTTLESAIADCGCAVAPELLRLDAPTFGLER